MLLIDVVGEAQVIVTLPADLSCVHMQGHGASLN